MKERKTIRATILPGKEKKSEDPSIPSRISKRLDEREEDPAARLDRSRLQRELSPPPVKENAGTPDPLRVATLLLQILGENVLRPLAENPRLRVPTPESAIKDKTEDAVDTRRWLADLMRAFLTHQGLAQLQRNLEAVNEESLLLRLKKEVKRLRYYLDEQSIKHKQATQDLERKISDANVQQKRLREQLQRSVPVSALIDAVFVESSAERAIGEILQEALDDPSDELGVFVGKVCIGWVDIRSALLCIERSEEERMQVAAQALQRFMEKLSGLFVPERRAVLKRIGQAVSAYFNEYDFASPEDWRHIDPSVHNAAGVGGQTVKEGLGFVVLRRGSGQTVIYADIIAE